MDGMNGHVEARRKSIREKAQRGDERAKRAEQGDALAWVDALLSRWGRWAIRCESGALGFASACSLGGSGDGDAYDSAVPRGVIDEDMEALDGAVRRLPAVLRVVVTQVYVHGAGKAERKNCDELGIHRDTLRKYLAEARRKIALDISRPCAQNPHQSVIGGNAPAKLKPALV